MAGMSQKSCNETIKRIVLNQNILKNKFSKIYIIGFKEPCKIMQTDAFNIPEYYEPIDELTHNFRTKFYEKSLKLDNFLADQIYNFINSRSEFAKKEIHILGKCAGAAIAIQLFTKNEKYKSLYLAVPASPLNVHHLIDKNIKNKKIIVAWDSRDHYNKFHWKSLSYQEKKYYDTTLCLLSDTNNYISVMFGSGEPHESLYHEIPTEMFYLM